jgi:TolB protein
MRLLRFPFAVAAGLFVLLATSDVDRRPVVTRRVERLHSVVVHGRDGATPRFALVSTGAADPAADEVIRVLGTDLAFESAFDLLPEEAVAGLPRPVREGDAGLPRWGARGADGVLVVEPAVEGDRLRVALRVFDVASGQLAFGREYVGPVANARTVAHVAANELHAAQAGLRGVATTSLAFVSDRSGSKREPTGYLRRVKEIFVADYDGANQRRVTFDGDIVLTPNWSPDGASLAYTSFQGGFQAVAFARPGVGREGRLRVGGKNWLPAWSPDGTRVAFTSNRDGNEEIYVAARDGSALTRLTRHWGIDTSPAWSPDGRQIAFTSGRSGRPQIWVMDAEGGNQRQFTHERYCDRPTWSPPPFDEIAYVSRTKTGFDIMVLGVGSGKARQLTFGEGFNESPAWAPSGRHLAFTSTRQGGQQIWTMTRTGERLRRVTQVGNNSMPAWGPALTPSSPLSPPAWPPTPPAGAPPRGRPVS